MVASSTLRRALFLGLALVAASSASAQVQTVAVPCAADVAIYSENGAVANGAGENLFVGANSTGAVRRSLLRFDVVSAVPAGSVVVGAHLTLNVNQGNSGDEPLTVRRVLASWVEGTSNPSGSEGQGAAASGADVTWTLRDFAVGTAWATPGGELAAGTSFAGPLGVSGASGFEATPTGLADVQSWIDRPSQNLGWALIGNEGVASSAKRLDSRSAANAAARPTQGLG